MSSARLRGAIIGCGFFAQHHLEAWRRIPEVELVAACDAGLDRARAAAPHAYASAEEMLDREKPDFVDIVTRADTHPALVGLAVARGIPTICQKPIASNWPAAVALVEMAESAAVPLMIHENWRWQAWHRVVAERIRQGDIGTPVGYGFRTRHRDGLGPDPYPRQSYFRELTRFLIDEALVHHLDTARFLFGDLEAVYAQAARRNPRIAGEDQALLLVTHRNSVQGWIDGNRFLNLDPDGPVMGEAFFEGEDGCLRILPTGDVLLGTDLVWKNDVATGYRGDSVRATQAHFIDCLRSGSAFETGGREYLGTFAAVEAAYRSLEQRRRVELSEVWAPDSTEAQTGDCAKPGWS